METNERQTTKNNITEIPQLLDLKHFMDHLLSKNQYIAKSCFKEKLEANDQVIQFFLVLKNSDMLDIFCQKNDLDFKEIETALDEYQNYESLIDEHNENFIQKTMKDENAQLILSQLKNAKNLLKEKDYNALHNVEELISQDKISVTNGTSILNDSAFVAQIANQLIEAVEIIFAKEEWLKEQNPQESIQDS